MISKKAILNFRDKVRNIQWNIPQLKFQQLFLKDQILRIKTWFYSKLVLVVLHKTEMKISFFYECAFIFPDSFQPQTSQQSCLLYEEATVGILEPPGLQQMPSSTYHPSLSFSRASVTVYMKRVKDCSCSIEYFLKGKKRWCCYSMSEHEYIYLGKLAISTQALVEFCPVV